MNSLTICLGAIAPLFLTRAAGFAAKRAGIIKESDISRMNAVAFKAFMPVMCFYNIYNSDLSSAVRPRLILFTVCAIFAVFGLSLGFRDIELVTLLAIFASSTAVASFTMAEQMGGDAALAGDIVVATSTLASFTLFGWSLLLKVLALY